MVLLIWLGWVQSELTHRLVTEPSIFGANIDVCANTEHQSLFLMTSGGMQMELYLHDFFLQKTWLIDDDRIPKTALMFTTFRNQFIILPFLQTRLFVLDSTGTLIATKNLTNFTGYERDFQPIMLCPYRDGRSLLSYSVLGSPQHFLAMVDFAKERVETIFQTEASDRFTGWAYWLTVGEQVVFLDYGTGEVLLFDVDKRSFGKVLIPPLEAVEHKAYKIFRHSQNKETEVLWKRIRYDSRVGNVWPLEHILYFEFVDFELDEDLLPSERSSLVSLNTRTSERRVMAYGTPLVFRTHPKGSLFFDKDEGELIVRSK